MIYFIHYLVENIHHHSQFIKGQLPALSAGRSFVNSNISARSENFSMGIHSSSSAISSLTFKPQNLGPLKEISLFGCNVLWDVPQCHEFVVNHFGKSRVIIGIGALLFAEELLLWRRVVVNHFPMLAVDLADSFAVFKRLFVDEVVI